MRTDARICDRCGAWLPLGPASDDSEAVRIEMRASALECSNEADFANCEWMGWNGDEVYFGGGSYHAIDKLPPRNLREWHAGYLARCIRDHDSEQDGGGIGEMIARSSIGVAMRDIQERGIDAHADDLARETKWRRK